jgi:hypothetical protein
VATQQRAGATDGGRSTHSNGSTPWDKLRTLEALVEICRAAGDDKQAREWCHQAMATAPDSVVERHRDWVDSNADRLGLD